MNTNSELKEFKVFLLDLIFPRTCPGCNKLTKELSKSPICFDCKKKIQLKQNFICAFCNTRVILGKTCPFCRKNYYLDRLFVGTDYENNIVKKSIKLLKYNFDESLADDIAEVMTYFLKSKVLTESPELSSAIICPAPLHWYRQNFRGFNQSEIIAKHICHHSNMKYGDLLTRRHSTKPQADIKDRKTRLANMQNIFGVKEINIKDKKIIVIDDVATTGSTLNDCARALKSAGAQEVIGFVFARNR